MVKRNHRARRCACPPPWRGASAAWTRIDQRPALQFQRAPACLQFSPDSLDPGGMLSLGRHHVHFPRLLGLPVRAGVTLERGHPGDPAFMDLLDQRCGCRRGRWCRHRGHRQQDKHPPPAGAQRGSTTDLSHRHPPGTAASVARPLRANRDARCAPSPTRGVPTRACGEAVVPGRRRGHPRRCSSSTSSPRSSISPVGRHPRCR